MSTLVPRLLATLLSGAACAAQPTIGAIDFFAYTGVDIETLRSSLTVRRGGPWTNKANQLLKSEIEKSLGRAPSDVGAVCCDEGGNRLIYIGLAEGSGSRVQFNFQPTGEHQLDVDFLMVYEQFEEAVRQAVSRGEGLVVEDHSLGYPLSQNADVRGFEQRIREYALSNSAQLFAVARESAKARHRAIAVDTIGYGLPSASQIEALTHSALDPDPAVRNNAIRALFVLVSSPVELQAPIPYATFVNLLASGVREDRTKSIALLAALTEDRDSAVLTAILERSLAPLVECARWSWSGHAYRARVILGRIAGIDDATISARAWNAEFVDDALAEIQRSKAR